MFVQTKDPEYRYVEYYARDSRDLLVAPETFLGRRMNDVLPPDLARSFEEVFRRAAASREPQVFEYSLPIGGAERRFEARAVECDDGQLLSIVRDITEQRNAAMALQKAEEGLARMSRASALGQLTASIAHEVHQPLNAITANAAACLRRLDEHEGDVSQIDEALLAILDDARRAAQVVKRTRGLFSGGPRVNALLDVNAEIGEVFVLMRHRPEARSGPILLELESGPLMVLGDRMQVQQVLMNLLVNASEAMSIVGNPERSISVRSWRAGAAIHVAVSDRGTGFDPDEIDRIFDAFYTTKSDGLGMGLAISRSIVHAHGGTLTARLNPDRGATFEFALPAAAEEARA
jgi:C4-dicarboxylate-specific signal transduction histidine kinase